MSIFIRTISILIIVLLLVPGGNLFSVRTKRGSGSTASVGLDIQAEEFIDTLTIVVKLEYVKAIEMKTILLDALSKYGSISINEGLNILIITDTKEKIANLQSIARLLDKKEFNTRQGLSTEVIVLQYLHPSKIEGFIRSKLSNQGILQINAELNALIISEVSGRLEEIKELIIKLDVPVKQILVKVSIVEVNLNDSKDIGIDWDAIFNAVSVDIQYTPAMNGSMKSKSTGSSELNTPTGNLSTSFNGRSRNTISGDNFSTRISLSTSQISSMIRLLIKDGNGKVLSTPQLVAQNNSYASLTAGEQIPYEIKNYSYTYNNYDSDDRLNYSSGNNNYSYYYDPSQVPPESYNLSGNAGNASYYQYQRSYRNHNTSIRPGTARSGLSFSVYPHINADQTVTMNIIVGVNSFIGYTPENKPIIFDRNIDTTVNVKDKETFILAGLKRESEAKTVNRFPVLGYIPVLSYLFSKEVSYKQKSEIVIFITPQIIKDSKSILKQFETDPKKIEKNLNK